MSRAKKVVYSCSNCGRAFHGLTQCEPWPSVITDPTADELTHREDELIDQMCAAVRADNAKVILKLARDIAAIEEVLSRDTTRG